jgi:hypothetical protein
MGVAGIEEPLYDEPAKIIPDDKALASQDWKLELPRTKFPSGSSYRYT